MGTDYDDEIETELSEEPALAPQLCAMISVDGVVRSVPLPDDGELSIGRGAACGLVIQHASVSRHHATLRMSPLSIIDAGSRNGTRLRGATLAAGVPTELAIGEAIQIGQATVLIHHRALVLETEPDARPGAAIDRMLDIEVARSARSRSPFAFLRVHVDGDAAAAHDRLRAILRTSDAVGSDAPGAFQVLLLDTAADQVAGAIHRIHQLLGQHGLAARIGVARYPHDGVTPEQLIAHAAERLAPSSASAMDGVRALAAQVATADLSVLIIGETGVGKELCAEMVHRLSPRAGRPFVKLNCSAIVESLIESELFGHERGAFTGATASRPGLFEAGDGGTVFLDEIGELPLSVQAKLLRVLEERVVRRIGATTGKTLDIRFIGATNRDLHDEVAAGRFRRDLYYRINGALIEIPPLRERRSEIGPLARAFAARHRTTLEPDVIAALERHAWPGNIRELRNTIERAAVLASGRPIRVAHLGFESEERRRATIPIPKYEPPDDEPLTTQIAELEKQRILQALDRCGGNQTRAARSLGISRNTLLARLDAYGLPRPRKS